MTVLRSILPRFSYWPPQKEKERRVTVEKGKERRQPVIVRSNACSDVSVDIVLVSEETDWKVLSPSSYMHHLPNVVHEAFRNAENDPWGAAEVSTWGSCQDKAKIVFKAVLKQTGETIGFGGFISSDLITAERKSSGKITGWRKGVGQVNFFSGG
jgi:hypothetical protein